MVDVIPGNPAGVRDLARHWTQQGEAAESASSTLGSAKNDIQGGTLGLKGDFAPKIQDAIGELPGELRKLAQGYRGCGRALDTFATKLAQAQAKSRTARDDWEAASARKRNAEYDLDALAPGWDAHAQSPTGLRAYLAGQPEPVMTAVTRRETADRDVDLATSLARQAAALRGDAERDCVREIKSALEDSGLKNRTWYQKVGDYLKESFTTWDGFVKLCESISLVLGVVALFLTGPLALIVGAVLLVAAAVAVADKLKKLADGEIGWKDLAFELGMVVLARFGGRALGPAFRRLANTKAVKGLTRQVSKGADRLASKLKLGDRARNLAHRAICTVTGHPIDVATGKMFTATVDLELPGPLPFEFERVWYSTSTYAGPLGHGWHHGYDDALYVTGDVVLYRTPDGRLVELPSLYPDTEYFDRQERLTLFRDESGYRVRDATGVVRRFAPIPLDLPEDSRPDTELVVHALRDVVNRAGQRISLRRDERGRLVAIVDSGGRELQFEYDPAGRISAFTAPHPESADERFAVARYAYDEAGNLVSVVDALEGEQRYEYDRHLMVRETDRTGLSFHFEYDGAAERARCVRTWGDGGIYERHLQYEPAVTSVTNALGQVTRYEHEDGLVVTTIDALGAETRTEYEFQQPVRETDALGRVTAREFDYRGNQIRTRTPDGRSVVAEFDRRDLPVRAVDRIDGEWTWTHDEAGLLVEVRDPLGRGTSFGYRSGRLATVTDTVGGVTVLDYDEQGSLAVLTTADRASTHWQRDGLGRPVLITDPLGNREQRRYDLRGRVVQVQEADGNVRELAYDGENNLLHAEDAMHQVAFSYQGLGRLATRTQAGTTVRFEYDLEEQLTGIVNQQGRAYGFAYGPTGEILSERGFDNVLRLYERDRAGRLSTVRATSGMVSRYTYDELDRVAAVEHSDGTGERFTHRADNTLISAENDTTRVTFERDALGRVVRETQGSHWVASEYDRRGSRVRMHSSFGVDEVIDRNEVGDVTGVDAAGFQARFTRNGLGQELTRQLPGGVETRWHRDGFGRPVRHEVVGATGMLRDRRYEWDFDDRLRGVADAAAGPIRYQHDALGQLASADYPDGRVDLRMPDEVGNLFRTQDRSDRTYGPAGQLLESTDSAGRRVRHEYDPDGRLVAKRVADGEVWSYRWGADGNLAAVTRPDGTIVTFAYDALRRRVSKTYRGQTTRWVWDSDVPLHEWVEGELDPGPRVDAGAIPAPRDARLDEFLIGGSATRGSVASPRTWLFEPESFAPLALIGPAGRESVVVDHLGTPVLTLAEDGAVTWAGDLSVWGELEAAVGPSWHCPFRFSGQYEDPETGLYYNRFRYYDPESGQYAGPDPIGLSGGLRLYGYVHDPVGWIDPLGLEPWTPNPGVDLDWSDSPDKTHLDALDEAFRRTGVPREDFTPTQWGTTEYGKTVPVEWAAPGGAIVNMDDPTLVPTAEGPQQPHVGYQSPGKRGRGGRVRGHILLRGVPATRGSLQDKKLKAQGGKCV